MRIVNSPNGMRKWDRNYRRKGTRNRGGRGGDSNTQKWNKEPCEVIGFVVAVVWSTQPPARFHTTTNRLNLPICCGVLADFLRRLSSEQSPGPGLSHKFALDDRQNVTTASTGSDGVRLRARPVLRPVLSAVSYAVQAVQDKRLYIC